MKDFILGLMVLTGMFVGGIVLLLLVSTLFWLGQSIASWLVMATMF